MQSGRAEVRRHLRKGCGVSPMISLLLIGRSLSYAINLPSLALSFVAILASFLLKKLLSKLLFRLALRYGKTRRRVMIIGNCAEAAQAFLREIRHSAGGKVAVVGAVGEDLGSINCAVLGKSSELGEILDAHHPDFAVFAMGSYNKSDIIRLVNLCDDRCVRVYFLPVLYGYLRSARQVERIGSTPLINAHSTPLDAPINAFFKRAVDIIGSLLLIILTSPIMLAVAIGVKISSPGPILFRQIRVGKMGKNFVMLKFRSMRIDPEREKTTWTTGVDGRKTRFGNFLRRTSIDELPQLFNVLAGKMSLVGPRPELPHFVERFKDSVPLYMVKHYVKPGITGLAQINGLRGNTSIHDRIYADIYYIESWTLWLDLSILLKTPFKAINKSEVYTDPDGKGKEK